MYFDAGTRPVVVVVRISEPVDVFVVVLRRGVTRIEDE
jgi:hypothetical protein